MTRLKSYAYLINAGGIRKVELLVNGRWLVTLSSGVKHLSDADTADDALADARKRFAGLRK